MVDSLPSSLPPLPFSLSRSSFFLPELPLNQKRTNPYYQTGSYAPYLYRHQLIGTVGLEAAAAVYETYKGLVDIGN
jgi:hypothetical protein